MRKLPTSLAIAGSLWLAVAGYGAEVDAAPQSNLTSPLSVVAGGAIDDTSATGSLSGEVLQGVVSDGAGYTGLSSSSNGGIKAANSDTALPGIEGTTAAILLGTNSGSFTGGGSATVSMTWRSRTLGETPNNDSVNGAGWPNGTPTGPPLSGSSAGLVSDVVYLYGMSSSSAAPSGTTTGTEAPVETDPFAFEMNFNPATLFAEGATGNAMASHGNLYLASLVPLSGAMIAAGGTPNWVNTIVADFSVAGGTTARYGPVDGGQITIQVGSRATTVMDTNTGGGNDGTRDATSGTFDFPLLESYATFASANNVTAANLANFVGVWGVDTTNDEAWAIINHNSEFAVVPEPSTIVLAMVGLALMVSNRLVYRRQSS